MDFAFSDEQDELRSSVRRFLEDKSPMGVVRRDMESLAGFDEALWKQATGELGLAGIAIPEAYGGIGFGAIEQGIIMEELGRSLACMPYLSSVVMSGWLLLLAGTESARDELLPGIASGERRVTIAAFESASGFSIESIKTTVSGSSGRVTVSGDKSYVLDATTATDFLVLGESELGPVMVAVPSSTAGVATESQLSMDLTRHIGSVRFERAEGVVVIGPDQLRAGFVDMLDFTSAALSNEMVGGAQRCLDMSVEYAKARIQFGRPIGSFQAIKHKCADMLVDVESAKSAAYYAAWAAAHDRDELRVAAPLAKAFCGDAYFHAAAETIQIHGGIGFTWEHDAHLYFKRAKSSQLLFGDSFAFREILAERIGI